MKLFDLKSTLANMEGILGTIFWAFTDPFIAFMGVLAGSLKVDFRTRFGAAFIIALILELVYVFIFNDRGFNLNHFAMNILAAFAWASIGAAVKGWLAKRKAENS